jgi:probable H4MPT-linked C1 transfer pathway protein
LAPFSAASDGRKVPMSIVIGWDVGGAHLKAACARDGRIVAAIQKPTPLWRGLSTLEEAFATARSELGHAERHAVTMTGELSDAFASRSEGVAKLAELAVAALTPEPIGFYAGRGGFVPIERIGSHVADIASANWHASARLIGRTCRNALFVDMGSTTTDIIPIVAGLVASRGYTDAERLATGELVYTGLVRSHVCATASHVPFAGTWTPLMNEFFATMADVHRIIGGLPPDLDQQPTADGRDKSLAASRARLARMVGLDAEDASDEAWLDLAHWLAERQLRSVHDAALQVLSNSELPRDAPIVLGGIGTDVLRELSRRLRRPCLGFAEFVNVDVATASDAAHYAPAAALALLAEA